MMMMKIAAKQMTMTMAMTMGATVKVVIEAGDELCSLS